MKRLIVMVVCTSAAMDYTPPKVIPSYLSKPISEPSDFQPMPNTLKADRTEQYVIDIHIIDGKIEPVDDSSSEASDAKVFTRKCLGISNCINGLIACIRGNK